MDAALSVILAQHDETGDITDTDALAAEVDRPLPPYVRLRSPTSTALPADAPRRSVTLKLTGDMTRYLWSLDDKTMDEESTIAVKKGEVLRLVLVNNTMMHHPMHLHGHFFRLLIPDAGDPAYAPLKHTVDVPPMSRRTIEFLASEDRDWLFHCHLLYHMMAGMARVVSYSEPPSSSTSTSTAVQAPNLGEHAKPHTYAWLDVTLQSHLSTGHGTVQTGRDNLNLSWETGWARVDDTGFEIDATYSRYFNPRWTAFAGLRAANLTATRHSAIAGATYRLPYLVDFTTTLQSNGDARFSLAKNLPLTARLGLQLHVEYDTALRFASTVTLAYTVSKTISLVASHDADYGLGAGVAVRF
jgi:hypothetical protein